MSEKDPREVFSENFRRVLHSQAVKQHHLADELEVSRGTVNRWANGKSLPGPKEMRELSLRLNWSYAAMFAEPGELAEDAAEYDEIIARAEELVRMLKGRG